MRPATFKTARESMGLTGAFVAERIGVTVGRIWSYESPDRTLDVPAHAAEVMTNLLLDFEMAADFLAEGASAPEAESITRHTDVEAFYRAVPALDGWGEISQALLLAEVLRRVPGIPIEYSE